MKERTLRKRDRKKRGADLIKSRRRLKRTLILITQSKTCANFQFNCLEFPNLTAIVVTPRESRSQDETYHKSSLPETHGYTKRRSQDETYRKSSLLETCGWQKAWDLLSKRCRKQTSQSGGNLSIDSQIGASFHFKHKVPTSKQSDWKGFPTSRV